MGFLERVVIDDLGQNNLSTAVWALYLIASAFAVSVGDSSGRIADFSQAFRAGIMPTGNDD